MEIKQTVLQPFGPREDSGANGSLWSMGGGIIGSPAAEPTYTTIDSFTWPAFVGPEIWLGIYDSQVFIYPVSGQLTGYQIGDYVTLSGTTHGLDVTKVEIIDVVTAAFGDNTIILSEEEVTPAWLEGITGSPFGGTPYYNLEGSIMTIERLV